jgi:T5orf172 domain
MPRAYGTHLYVVSNGELCKVGRSMDVHRRVQELKRSNPWGEIRLVATFEEAGFMEPWVLRALCMHERRGEWVKCTVSQALAAVGAVFV